MPVEYISNRQSVPILDLAGKNDPVKGGPTEFLTLKNLERADFVSMQFQRVPATKQEVENQLSDAYKEVFDVQEQGEGNSVAIALKEGKGLQEASDAIKAQFKADLDKSDSGMLGKIWAKFKNFAGNAVDSIKQFFGTEGRPLGMVRTRNEVELGDGKTKTVYNFKLTSGGDNKGAGDIQVDRRSYSGVKNFFAQLARWNPLGIVANLAYYACTGKSLFWQYTAKGQLHNKALQDAESLKPLISEQVKDIVVMDKSGKEEKIDQGRVGSLKDFLHLAYNKTPEQIRSMVREELKNPKSSFLNTSQATKIDEKRSLLNPLRWISWVAPEWLVSSNTAEGKDASRLADKVADQIADGIIEGIAQGHIHLVKEVIADQKTAASETDFNKILAETKPGFDRIIKDSADPTKIADSRIKLESLANQFRQIKDSLPGNQTLGAKNQQAAGKFVDDFLQDIETCQKSLNKAADFVQDVRVDPFDMVEEVSVQNLPEPPQFRPLNGINDDISALLSDSQSIGAGDLGAKFEAIGQDIEKTRQAVNASKKDLLEIHHTGLATKLTELESSLAAAKKAVLAEREVLAELKNGTTGQTLESASGKIQAARLELGNANLNPMDRGVANQGESTETGIDSFKLRLDELETAIRGGLEAYQKADTHAQKADAIFQGIRGGQVALQDLTSGSQADWKNLGVLINDDAKNLEGLRGAYGFQADLDPRKNLETFQSNAVSAALGLDPGEQPDPALVKLFTPQTTPILDALKAASQKGGLPEKLGKLAELGGKGFSPANALETIKTAETILGDSLKAADLAKIFAPGEQFAKFFNNRADLRSATSDLDKAIANKTIPVLADKLGIGPCTTPNELLQVFLKLPQIGQVSPQTQESIKTVLEQLGNLQEPSAEALANIKPEDLQTLKEVAKLLGNEGIYTEQNIASIEAQIQAANHVAALSNDLVPGQKDGLKSPEILGKIKAGTQVSEGKKAEFDQINNDLGVAVENYLDCQDKISLYTAKLDAHAEAFASITGKNSGKDAQKVDKEFVLRQMEKEKSQEGLKDIARMSTAYHHFLNSEEDRSVRAEVDLEPYFLQCFSPGKFKQLAKEPFSSCKTFSELGETVARSENKKAGRELEVLQRSMQNREWENNAYTELRKTLTANQQKNISTQGLKALFDPPKGKTAEIRAVREAHKRLITNTEFDSNYTAVSDGLKKAYFNRFEALKETKQQAAIERLERDLSPQAVKTLFKENPAKLGKMLRDAESAKTMSKDAWKNSYFAGELSDSSAKLARFNLLTLEYGKLGLFEKIKKNLFGIDPQKPAIQGQVEKFIHSYPGLDQEIAGLLSNQQLLADKKELFDLINNQLDEIISRRDTLVKEGDRLMARHATALVVAEQWRDQRMEAAHFKLDQAALYQKLAEVGVDQKSYPDLKKWVESDLPQTGGVGKWLDAETKGIQKCKSELEENRARLQADMQAIGQALDEQIQELQKAGEDLSTNKLRFTPASLISLENAGLLSSLNKDLFKANPLKPGNTLGTLFEKFGSGVFKDYPMDREGSMTLLFKTQLDKMQGVYASCFALDKELSSEDGFPPQALRQVKVLQDTLDEAVNELEAGSLKDHKFTKLIGTDNRQQLKEALSKQSKDWPRTPLQEIKLLISQRLDRLAALANSKQADIDQKEALLLDDGDLQLEMDEDDLNGSFDDQGVGLVSFDPKTELRHQAAKKGERLPITLEQLANLQGEI